MGDRARRSGDHQDDPEGRRSGIRVERGLNIENRTYNLEANAPISIRQLAQTIGELVEAFVDELSGSLFASAEAREGMGAFLERRSPSWAPATDD